MQSATLTIPVGTHGATDGFYVLGNVDEVGRATAGVDQRVSGEANRPYWPLVIENPDSGFKAGPHKDEEWKGQADPVADLSLVTPPMYHGEYSFVVVAVDAAGNENDDGTPETVVVNSGPQMLVDMRRIADTEDGRLQFAFTSPPQFM